VPTTREALLKAQLYCDQRTDFDECTRAAHAFEVGSTGPADPGQAKRFRKIALTYLVQQCERGGSPHACFVLAAKYRAGTEVALSPSGAMALEKRGLELCRHRTAPECPEPTPYLGWVLGIPSFGSAAPAQEMNSWGPTTEASVPRLVLGPRPQNTRS
jgi:hypothetical protein